MFLIRDLKTYLILTRSYWIQAYLLKGTSFFICKKVSKFQNEFMTSSFLPKYEPNIVRTSAFYCTTLQGRSPYKFGSYIDDFINSFWNLPTFRYWYRNLRRTHLPLICCSQKYSPSSKLIDFSQNWSPIVLQIYLLFKILVHFLSKIHNFFFNTVHFSKFGQNCYFSQGWSIQKGSFFLIE